MMTTDQELKSRFQRLVPFYLNHTLNKEDLKFFNEMLAAHPDWSKLVEFDSLIQKAVVEQTVPVNIPASFERLKRQMESNQLIPWWKKLNFDFLRLHATPIVAMCLLVMFGQYFYILNNPYMGDVSQFRSWKLLQPKLTQYKLIIKPETRYSEVTRLLQETHCQIVSGPYEDSHLIVGCQSNSQAIQTIFEKSPLLNDVLPLK